MCTLRSDITFILVFINRNKTSRHTTHNAQYLTRSSLNTRNHEICSATHTTRRRTYPVHISTLNLTQTHISNLKYEYFEPVHITKSAGSGGSVDASTVSLRETPMRYRNCGSDGCLMTVLSRLCCPISCSSPSD